jgi:hypothetical protein
LLFTNLAVEDTTSLSVVLVLPVFIWLNDILLGLTDYGWQKLPGSLILEQILPGSLILEQNLGDPGSKTLKNPNNTQKGKTWKYTYLGTLTFEDPHWVRPNPRSHTKAVAHLQYHTARNSFLVSISSATLYR